MTECIVTEVPNRLGMLLRKSGGITRGLATKAAETNVERLRDEFVGAIPDEIAALEALLVAGGGKHITPPELDAMLRRASQILTLSGTFGFDRLDIVVKRFCDLALGMVENSIADVAPLSVHLRAMRILSPTAAKISDPEFTHILDGLAAVHRHYRVERKSP